jgi:hypothetical protein
MDKQEKAKQEAERFEALKIRAIKEHQWQLIHVTHGRPDPDRRYELHATFGTGPTHIFGNENTTLDDIEKYLDGKKRPQGGAT